MTKIDRYKILVRYLISIGVATTQKDLGTKMGYNNESAFSQVINGKTAEPKNFSRKLKELMPDINLEWLETGVGEMLGGNINQEVIGDNSTSVAGNLNNVNCSTAIEKAIEEISEMRKLIQEQVRNNKEQFDRLMSVIERLTSLDSK